VIIFVSHRGVDVCVHLCCASVKQELVDLSTQLWYEIVVMPLRQMTEQLLIRRKENNLMIIDSSHIYILVLFDVFTYEVRNVILE